MSLRVLVYTLTAILVLGASKPQQGGKFQASAQLKAPKACGDGLDENSACGDCAYVIGVGVTKSTRCGHVCVKLPDGKTDQNMSLFAEAANDTTPPSFERCGGTNAAGPCQIGWSRFEGIEYYSETNQLCGRFKNWSNTSERIFKITVT